jgi:hypothetical protein
MFLGLLRLFYFIFLDVEALWNGFLGEILVSGGPIPRDGKKPLSPCYTRPRCVG